jgi:hypothetical protein
MLSASDDPSGGAMSAIDQKKVKFLKFGVQKKEWPKTVSRCRTETSGETSVTGEIGSFTSQEGEAASFRMLRKSGKMLLLQRARNPHRQKLAPKNLVFPEKTLPAARPVLAKPRIPLKNGRVSFGKSRRFSKNAGITRLFGTRDFSKTLEITVGQVS